VAATVARSENVQKYQVNKQQGTKNTADTSFTG